MNKKDYNKFADKFLEVVPYLGGEVDQYANDYLIELIKTADEEVHNLFFPAVPRDEKKTQEISIHKLSVLCVANVLSVCNNASISGRFKAACARQINQWFELNSSETGQIIFRNLLESKLEISKCTRECIRTLYGRLTKPPLREIMQIFVQTKTPVPAQLIVSAMKAIDSQYGELLIQKWLSETPKNYKDLEWWDAFQQIQIYPWFHGVGASFFCDRIKTEIEKVLRDNVNGIYRWLDSVNGPDKYGLLNFG